MSDSVDNTAPAPCFIIPSRFEGATLSRLAEDIAAGCPEGWPPSLVLDFKRLNFIQPAGVIFLSNLIWWLHQHGTSVRLINAQPNVEALRYLDDSRFFEQHAVLVGKCSIFPDASRWNVTMA
jgi:STAS domain-containing protein